MPGEIDLGNVFAQRFGDPSDPNYRVGGLQNIGRAIVTEAMGGAPGVPVLGDGVPAQSFAPGAVSTPDAILGAWSPAPLSAPYQKQMPSGAGSRGTAPAPPAPPADRAPSGGGPPAAPARSTPDPLCSMSIEHLRAHGVPGKPEGWLQRVERELCSPELAQYDIPVCPERQAMKFGTSYARQIDTLGSPSASARESARKTLETRMRAAPFNRGLLPGPDGVLRRERQCSQIVGSRAASPAAPIPEIEQIPPAEEHGLPPAPGAGPPIPVPPRPAGAPPPIAPAGLGIPERPLVGVPLPRDGRGTQPAPAYQHPTFTFVIPARPGVSRPNENREVVNGGLVWDTPDVRDPAGFLGILDPSDIDSAGMYSYRPSQGGLPYDPSAPGQQLPAADGSLMELRSTSDFGMAFDETGEIWPAYS